MRKTTGIIALGLCFSSCQVPIGARVLYVAPPPSGDDSNPGTQQEPFATIQKGIDSASDADTVIVGEGTYVENINFNGKNIVLRSTNPLDPTVVENTIIDGRHAGPVVSFEGTENEGCVLEGFTIWNGEAERGAGICGGTSDHQTRATIQNNTLAVNMAHGDGGALAACGGVVQDNTMIANSAKCGGALYACDGMIVSNWITWNSADCGGGLYAYDGTIQDNGFLYNSALDGGALAHCRGTIQGNTIGWNHADYAGGGMYRCDGAIRNNEVTFNVALDGGGLSRCGGTVDNNRVRGNRAEYGGGLYECNGTVQNNTIGCDSALHGEEQFSCSGRIPNSAIYGNDAEFGGGLARCAGMVRNNTICGNSATSGAGLAFCDGTVDNNVISGNSAGRNGGGLYHCEGSIRNNLVADNSAGSDGDGGGLYRCDGVVGSNTIAGNRAGFGAGLAYCRGTIQNNTITGNSAFRGGGVHGCAGRIVNCVIWKNTALGGSQVWESTQPTYSCIQDWTEGGEGNIAEDPRFVDVAAADNDPETYHHNDYRLLPHSPCIDAGHNTVLNPPGLDLDGNLRIAFGRKSLTVDMGAYEYNSLPFAVTEMIQDDGGVQVIWNSQPNDTYGVLSCFGLSVPTWTEEAAVASQGAFTWWTGTAPASPLKFYRIEMK